MLKFVHLPNSLILNWIDDVDDVCAHLKCHPRQDLKKKNLSINPKLSPMPLLSKSSTQYSVPANYWSIFRFYRLVFSRILYKCTHKVNILMCLVCFPHYNTSSPHPSWVSQQHIFVFCWPILYTYCFTHLSVAQCLGCCLFLTVTSKAAVNLYMSLCGHTFLFLW